MGGFPGAVLQHLGSPAGRCREQHTSAERLKPCGHALHQECFARSRIPAQDEHLLFGVVHKPFESSKCSALVAGERNMGEVAEDRHG